MKINFTKKEYRLLLDMLYISNWVINSHIPDAQVDGSLEHQALRKKLLSYYKEIGVDDVVNYDSKNDAYYEFREYEENLHEQFIDPYDDENFWDNLIDRLSLRDLINQIGEEKLQALDNMERFNLLENIRELYTNEFETNGLTRIQIKNI